MLMQDPVTGEPRGYLLLYHDPDIPAIVIPPAPHDDCLESNIFEDDSWYYQGTLPPSTPGPGVRDQVQAPVAASAAPAAVRSPVPATPAAASVPATLTAGFALAPLTIPAVASVPASPEASFALAPVTTPAAVSVPVILTPGSSAFAELSHLDNVHEARVIGQMMFDVINVSLSN